MKKGRDLLFLLSFRTLHHQTPNSSNLASNAIGATPFRETMQQQQGSSSSSSSDCDDSSNRYSYNPTLRWNPQVHHYFLKAYGSDRFSRISSALTYLPHFPPILCFHRFFPMLNFMYLDFAGVLLATPVFA